MSTWKSSGRTPGRSARTISWSSRWAISMCGRNRPPNAPRVPSPCPPPPKKSRSMSSLRRRKSENGLPPKNVVSGSSQPSRRVSRLLDGSCCARPDDVPASPWPCSPGPLSDAVLDPAVPPCPAAPTLCCSLCAMGVLLCWCRNAATGCDGSGCDSSHAERECPRSRREPRAVSALGQCAAGGDGRLGSGDVPDDRLLARLGAVGALEEHHLTADRGAVLRPDRAVRP